MKQKDEMHMQLILLPQNLQSSEYPHATMKLYIQENVDSTNLHI